MQQCRAVSSETVLEMPLLSVNRGTSCRIKWSNGSVSADNENPYSLESRKRVIGETISQVPLLYTDPVIIGHHPDAVGQQHALVNSASGVYMRFGDRLQLAISNHVLQIYERLLKEDHRAVFQFASVTLNPHERLIGRNATTDIAMIDMTGLLPVREDGNDGASLGLTEEYKTTPLMAPLQAYRTYKWPPDPVRVGDNLFLGGFPDTMRTLSEGGRKLSHGSFTIAGIQVTGVFYDPDRFTCRYDPSQWETAFAPEDGSDIVIPDFSGMSGCPIFRDAKDQSTFTFDLVGFVIEEIRGYHLLSATSSSNIKLDGTLW